MDDVHVDVTKLWQKGHSFLKLQGHELSRGNKLVQTPDLPQEG